MNIKEYQQMVSDLANKISFHTGAQGTRDIPTLPDYREALRLLRIKLEEDLELSKGLGVDIIAAREGEVKKSNLYFQKSVKEPCMRDIADGICDSIYTSFFMATILGIDLEPLMVAVAENNLKKFGPGGYFDGEKWIKPADHIPPPIDEILKEQGYEG